MKRFLLIAAVAALFFAVPLTHEAIAGHHRKANLCHNTEQVGQTVVPCDASPRPGFQPGRRVIRIFAGKVVNVNENAVPAHLAHGDFFANPNLDAGDDCRRAFAGPCRPNR